MSEIKFRGKSIAEEWHYGLLARSAGLSGQPDEGVYILNTMGAPYAYQVVPKSIGEYIGKTDKNNSEIYEGDILKDECDRIMLVKWYNRGFCFKAITETNFMWACNISQWFEGGIPPEIIGNKYENPELLEEVK